MRYTFYRGLAQVSNWVRLKFATMNLKKLARWKARNPFSLSSFLLFPVFYFYNSLRFVLEETRQAAFRQAEGGGSLRTAALSCIQDLSNLG